MSWSEAEHTVLTQTREFAYRTVAPAAARWSMGGTPDPALFLEAAKMGLMGLEVPVTRGGGGLSFSLKAAVLEALGGADFGFALSVVNTHNVALRLSHSAPPEVTANVVPDLVSGKASACTALTEPGAGSDFAAIVTKAERRGENVILNGEKSWIVNGRHARYAIVFAQFGNIGDASGIGSILVDLNASGVAQFPQDAPFSQTSIGTGRFTLDNVAMPAAHVILEPGAAFKSILTEINGARAYVAAICCGMLSAGLRTTTAYGTTRHAFGVPLSTHQGWRHAIGEASIALAAARALATEAVAAVNAEEDAQLSAAQAKVFAVDACQKHLPALLHAMGAAGLEPDCCLSRHIAAAQIAGLTDGATGLLRDRIAKLGGIPRPT